MRLDEILRLVLINIKQNKFKVFLTSLGIIVGAATIVLVIAIGEGGKRDVEEQFKTLNAGTITVTSSGEMDMEAMMAMRMSGGGGGPGSTGGGGTAPSGGGGGERSSGGGMSGGMAPPSFDSTALTAEDLENVLFFVPDIVEGAISASTESDVLGGVLEEADSFTIVGTEEEYASISNLSPIVGTFLTETDSENETRCVVLGYDVAIEIFEDINDAYDSKIDIDGRSYVVNGVLASTGGSAVSGINPDTTIFMPFSTAEKYLFERDYSPQFSILATDVDAVASVMENIELVLTQANPNTMYTIEDAGATMDAAMQSANTLSLLLLAVAVIVFVVGGIGIMNVLFVSVKERTREIGVLKAIGTKKGDILLLFLVEACMIGFFGGVFGVLVSFGIVPLMEYVDITAVLTVESVLLAFGFAVITGTVFGVYPAFKASNLIPIEALNNE